MQTTSNIIDKNWKALIKPNKLDISSNEDKTIAKVIAEPLEKGFGQTIGNSLRRILLSSIQGAAVTAIQIDGVLHEFSSIKGVREDVTDIVLNVKNLAIKSSSSSSKKIILDIKGPKEVKAKDITLVPDVEILNPEQTICNLDEKTHFHMELMVSTGKGYVQAKKNKSDSSALVAEKLAKLAKEKNLTKVFFDRGIYKYHGRIKIFAETLRKNGMEF